MPPAPRPERESERLAALRSCSVLDSEPEQAYDQLADLAAYVCDTPMALISLVDECRQWFKASFGLSVPETPRDQAVCAYSILQSGPLVILDLASDPRTCDNPLVTGELGLRFYAGIPLHLRSGETVGTLCVLDTEPRVEFSGRPLEALTALGAQAVELLELRRAEALASEAIERLEAANERIAQHNRGLEELVHTASHDLKSPLVTIEGFAGQMAEEAAELGRVSLVECAERVSRAVDRMRSNIDDVMRFGRAGLDHGNPRELSVREAVDEALQLHESAIRRRGVSVTVTVGDSRAWCDPSWLAQILDNLVGNAVRHGTSAERPSIEVRACEQDDGMTEIHVDDNGAGFEADRVERAFRLFERQSPDSSGSGVGLAIVRRVAEQYGGRAWIIPAPGEGARVRVQLPTSAPASAGNTTPSMSRACA